jgi:fluoride exporter
MLNSILAISAGASLGAVLRWLLGMSLNAMFPTVPPGTLAANLIGGFFIGLAIPVFINNPWLASEWRFFVVTGFLGGLTTFSTFSAEVTTLLQQGRWFWALGAIALHVLGSLIMTMLGLATASALKSL